MNKLKETQLVESAIQKVRENPESYEVTNVSCGVDRCDITLDVDEFGEVVLSDTTYYAFTVSEDGDVEWSFNTGTDAPISVDGPRGGARASAGSVENEFYIESDDGTKHYRYFTVHTTADRLPDHLKHGEEFDKLDDDREEETEVVFEREKELNPDTKYFNALPNLPDGWFTSNEANEVLDVDFYNVKQSLEERGALESRRHPDSDGYRKQWRVTDHGYDELERLS